MRAVACPTCVSAACCAQRVGVRRCAYTSFTLSPLPTGVRGPRPGTVERRGRLDRHQRRHHRLHAVLQPAPSRGSFLCVSCESLMESHLLVLYAERLIFGPLTAYGGSCEQWSRFRYARCALATSDLRPRVFLHFACCTRPGHDMVRRVRIMLRDGVFRLWGW